MPPNPPNKGSQLRCLRHATSLLATCRFAACISKIREILKLGPPLRNPAYAPGFTLKRTKLHRFKKKFRGSMPPNPPTFAHRCAWLRDMQIHKSEKKILGPPLPNPGDAPAYSKTLSYEISNTDNCQGLCK